MIEWGAKLGFHWIIGNIKEQTESRMWEWLNDEAVLWLNDVAVNALILFSNILSVPSQQ